jgi:hypothetical protein
VKEAKSAPSHPSQIVEALCLDCHRRSHLLVIEVNPVVEMLSEHLKCPKCTSKMEVMFPTICITSSVWLECINTSFCTHAALSKPTIAEEVMLDEEMCLTR